MKISVALCTYNGEKFLREQLESIVGQTRHPLELVACDDCSQDGTVAVLSAFAEHAPFPVHIHRNETNLGSTKNFEKAISLCQGECIALSDQDDVWRPHKLACLEEALLANPQAGYVFSDADLVAEDLHPLGHRLWDMVGFDEKLRKLFIREEQLKILLKRDLVTGATMAFRSSVANMAMPFPTTGRWIHDGWIAILASSTGSFGIPICEPLIAYRQHASQQIGAPESPVGGQKQSLMAKHQELKERQHILFADWDRHCRQVLEMYATLLKIRQRGPNPALDWSLRYLQTFETHYLARRQILTAKKNMRRNWLILREAISGRYGEFSDSWRSLFRDLFL